MSLSVSLYSEDYFEHLRSFRDRAFANPNTVGQRRTWKGFVFGEASTSWVTEEGGSALLQERGIRYRQTTILPLMPTILGLAYKPSDAGCEIVRYQMDVDDIGSIIVDRYIVVKASFMEVLKARMVMPYEDALGLRAPSDEELNRLYSEMQRGANGQHTSSV